MTQQSFTLTFTEKEEIKFTLKDFLKSKDEIIFAYIHGSFIEEGSFHDIDVAVFISNDVTAKDTLEYELSLSSMLEYKIRLPVDVKVLNYAPYAFCYEVTRGDMIFSRDEDTRFGFVERIWIKYLDYKPVAEGIIRDLVT